MGLNWNGAFAAAGGAVAEVGAEMGKSAIREGAESRMLAQRGAQESSLMKERAAIEDMRLQRERDRMSKVGTEAEAARNGVVEEMGGTVRPYTPAESAQAAAGVYNKNGMIAEAMRTREFETQRAAQAEDKLDRRVDRTADNERADRQLEESKRHNQAVERIQAATQGRLAKGADLDNAIKQIQIDNVKRVESLKTEFSKATPERKTAIKEEIQLITGKDNDNFLPVAIKDEMGNITDYRVFDQKSGEWVQPKGQAGGKTGWDPDTKQVFKDGKVIGTAPTGNDGRRLVAGNAAPAPKSTAPAMSPIIEGARNRPPSEDDSVSSMSVSALRQVAQKTDALGAAAKRRLEIIDAQKSADRERDEDQVRAGGIGFGRN